MVSAGRKLLWTAEGGTEDVDGRVAGDLRDERTGFTTDLMCARRGG